MTYEDPRSGRERNLGQDDVGTSTGSWIAGLIILAAVAFGAWYYYDHTRNVADLNHPATNTAGTTTTPAAQPDNSSSTGASTGTSGATTTPSAQPAQEMPAAKTPETNTTPPNAPKP
ncbi:MAG: hypothetical protein J0I81_03750 [Hyphomicrobium sp.]|nr:hypothetical protein [Hyphomicrobium sp.]